MKHPNLLTTGTLTPGVAGFLAAAALPPAGWGQSDVPLWKFYAEQSVTLTVPISDLSGNGGLDVLVGSADDTLYLVEGTGAKAGAPHWQAGFKSTLSAAAGLGDVDGDGKADVAGGDQLGLIQGLSGATGKVLWKFLTFGTVMSLAAVPDADGDQRPDLVAGSENDTLYCLSGGANGLGKVIWEFGLPRKMPGRPCPPFCPPGAPPPAAGRDSASGVNSVALIRDGQGAFCVAAGTNVDTVYCFPTAGGIAKWKTGLPGDAWKVSPFPDQDGDGIEEVLVACGADLGILLRGADGAMLWSHAVALGAASVAPGGDVDGDGHADALIGDGNGGVHCVSGAARGAKVPSLWTFSFGDSSTITALATLGDLDGDSRPECGVGTSNDMLALLGSQGGKLFSLNLGGPVGGVGSLGDIDGNGAADVVAGTEMGFAAAYSWGKPAGRILPRPAAGVPRSGAGLDILDLNGRKLGAPVRGRRAAGRIFSRP